MNNWCVVNDDGDLAGYKMSKIHAEILANQLQEKEPNAGWEALEDNYNII